MYTAQVEPLTEFITQIGVPSFMLVLIGAGVFLLWRSIASQQRDMVASMADTQNTINKAFAASEARATEIEDRNRATMEANADLAVRLAKLEGELNIANQFREDLQRRLSSMEHLYATTTKEVSKLNDDLRKLTDTLAKERELRHAVEQDNASLLRDKELAVAERATAIAKQNELLLRLEKAEGEIKELRAHIAQLETQIKHNRELAIQENEEAA